MASQLVDIERLLHTHHDRLKILQALFNSNSVAPPNTESQSLEARISALERNSVHSLDESISGLKEEIRLLKERVTSSDISIGSQVFQSYEDFAVWVKTGIPSGCFGVFVVANSFHSSNKSGFKSMLETRVAASMQNFFPAPFGKTASDKLDDSET